MGWREKEKTEEERKLERKERATELLGGKGSSTCYANCLQENARAREAPAAVASPDLSIYLPSADAFMPLLHACCGALSGPEGQRAEALRPLMERRGGGVAGAGGCSPPASPLSLLRGRNCGRREREDEDQMPRRERRSKTSGEEKMKRTGITVTFFMET